jgi:hypothetical protein
MTDSDRERTWPPRHRDFEQDLAPEVEGEERQELIAMAVRLTEQRPVPRPGLRSAIRARLLGGGRPVARSRIGALIFGYATSGALLLAVALVGLVGVGPFAA